HTRNLLRLFTSLVQNRVELLVADLPDTLLERSQKLDRRFCQIAFQLRVTFTRKMIFNCLRRLARDQVINLEQVIDRRSRRIEPDLCSRVSHSALELLLDRV